MDVYEYVCPVQARAEEIAIPDISPVGREYEGRG
jgi:hypothetical protein